MSTPSLPPGVSIRPYNDVERALLMRARVKLAEAAECLHELGTFPLTVAVLATTVSFVEGELAPGRGRFVRTEDGRTA